MPNHVHLVLVPPSADALALALREAHRRYTAHVNRRHGWTGYLWQGRFASAVLDQTHLLAAARYIERNPVRAGLAAASRGREGGVRRRYCGTRQCSGLHGARFCSAEAGRHARRWLPNLSTPRPPRAPMPLHR